MSDEVATSASVQQVHREASTIGFPYLDLDDAKALCQTAFVKAGGECPLDKLAADLGHDTTNSGAFRQKLATARMFGLIELRRDSMALSSLGFEIVETDREKAAAARAFLKVPLYKATFDRFRGRQLPPDAALERVFSEMGVAKKQAAKARQVFQRSAESAGFFGSGRDRLVEPVLPKSAASQVPAKPREEDTPKKGVGTEDVPELVTAMFKQLPPSGSSFARDRRVKWLQTLENILELVYGNEDF